MAERRTAFEWDDAKESVNLSKHGVSFELAQHAFFDLKRVIVPDLDHSGSEPGSFASAK